MGCGKNKMRHQQPTVKKEADERQRHRQLRLELRSSSPFAMGVQAETLPNSGFLQLPQRETSSSNHPGNQLGFIELQRTAKHCPDGLTMHPGFMALSRSSAGMGSLGRLLS